ncbi:MAG TPA: helix-turn-helix domain-containing protein [Acidimicrobiia bacterium]|nr:helix-turn-helix domain-containing protein [Acidimicrobiia bacterium]
MPPLSDEQFARILEFRVALRRFGRFSEEQAAKLDMTAAQYQLLLAIRGHGGPPAPTIADVARRLMIRHHSAVGLVDRTRDLGLVERRRDDDDHRLARLALTPLGHERVNALALAHLKELRNLAEVLGALLEADTDGVADT